MPRQLRNVGSIMNADIPTVSLDTTVDAVASLMETRRITCLVVMDGDEAVGMVSERDLVNKVVAPGLAPHEVKCSDIMTSPVYTIRNDVDLGRAYEEMEAKWSTRFAVTDDAGDLSGLVTQSDLIAGLYEELQETMFENELLHQEALVQERLSEQTRVARRLQSRFIPDESPNFAALEVAGSNTQAHDVGGDFFDYIPIDDESIGVVIADVVGNGVPAALLMVMTRSILRSQAMDRTSPAAALQKANITFCAEEMPGQFVTMFYCVVKRQERRLMVGCAGHPPMMVYRQATGEIEFVDCFGLPLGVRDEGAYEEVEVCLGTDDAALLYTDGLIEVRGADGDMFGIERLAEAFRQSAGEPLSDVLSNLSTAIEEFAAEDERLDDRTAVILRGL